MTDLATMLAEIQSDTQRTATAQVTAMRNKINAAIRHYKSNRFWFNETRAATFNTVIGTDTYTFNTATTTGTIPYEFYKIDGVWVTFAAGDVREMDEENYADLEAEADSQTTNNQPTAYGYINRALRFDYAPDAIYSVRIAGHLKIAAPATDDETDNPWMTEAYDLIMSRAKAELYAHRWEDPGNAALMVQAEQSALRSLQDSTVDRLRSGFVTPTEF